MAGAITGLTRVNGSCTGALLALTGTITGLTRVKIDFATIIEGALLEEEKPIRVGK